MNVDRILLTVHEHSVDCLLIGGMNFLLRHAPILTFDVDLWIEDTPGNLGRCEAALAALDAEWGAAEVDWGPVAAKPAGWLSRQMVYCLTSRHGAVDVFRAVRGLSTWRQSRARAIEGRTQAGAPYVALCDEDMLACQLALPEPLRKLDRIRILNEVLRSRQHD